MKYRAYVTVRSGTRRYRSLLVEYRAHMNLRSVTDDVYRQLYMQTYMYVNKCISAHVHI